jgi:ammonium transporter, Amt family
VHISSGAAALAYSIILGRRRRANGQIAPKVPSYRPHNVSMVVLGIVMLWFGWFGFNGGSALNSSLRSVYAATNTNFAAASGLFTWVLIDYIYLGKWSAVGAASGALAGLVGIALSLSLSLSTLAQILISGITPACGYVPVYFSPVIGIVTAFRCNYSTKLKFYMNADDGLDAFGLHGIGGYVGSILTGLFAADYVPAMDGATVIPGGWINGHWVQLGYQLAGSTAYTPLPRPPIHRVFSTNL